MTESDAFVTLLLLETTKRTFVVAVSYCQGSEVVEDISLLDSLCTQEREARSASPWGAPYLSPRQMWRARTRESDMCAGQMERT